MSGRLCAGRRGMRLRGDTELWWENLDLSDPGTARP